MRYGISPAERNNLQAAYKYNNNDNNELEESTEDRSHSHENRRADRQKLYGKMRTRKKPEHW